MSDLLAVPLTTIDGRPQTLADYAGHVLLIVNVASKCGLTPQYTALEQLFSAYKERGLVVLGFPANDFAGQEPGTDAEIAQFCSTTYPVTFPLFSKAAVTGPEKQPLYRALTNAMPEREDTGSTLRASLATYASAHGFPAPNELPEVLWNFEKFVIGRDGTVLARFAPDIAPDDPRITQTLEAALNR